MDEPDIDQLQNLLDESFPITHIATIFKVCKKTIYRWISRFNLRYQRFTTISDADLIHVIQNIKVQHPKDGEILIEGHLKAMEPPIKVQRHRLRRAIHQVDPEGVIARRSKTIKRRQYSVPCPHYLWHVDGNHKLRRYKMVIHGGIDGFTRLVVFMNVSTNNRAETVQAGFLKAVEEFDWPIRLRTDLGGENEKLWQLMLEKRGPKSALVGSSVHNQPIEQLWGVINDRGTLQFRELFREMEVAGELNVDNDTDMICLHWVFLPIIQKTLTELAKSLNKRKISTEKQRTPYQLLAEYVHLKMDYEEQPIAEHGGAVDVAYQDPGLLPRPLQHVICEDLAHFPHDLLAQLQQLEVAHSLEDGRALYRSAVAVVGNYVLTNANNN